MTARHRTLLLDRATTTTDVLKILAPGDSTALAQGRIFADRRRVPPDTQWLERGVTVDWYAERSPRNLRSEPPPSIRIAAQPTATSPPDFATLDASVPHILEQREGLVAVYKPAAWSSEPDRTGQQLCLSDFLARQLRGGPVHIATRLDVGVSGLVLAATDETSRRRLTDLSQRGELHRVYVAIASGAVAAEGQWRGSVEPPSLRQKGRGPAAIAQARDAITHFTALSRLTLPGSALSPLNAPATTVSLVCFRPETGRKHQLRIHASRNNHPLLGDPRYGGPTQMSLANGRIIQFPRIFLQAIGTSVSLAAGRIWTVRCPLDSDMGGLWPLLGGSHADFAT